MKEITDTVRPLRTPKICGTDAGKANSRKGTDGRAVPTKRPDIRDGKGPVMCSISYRGADKNMPRRAQKGHIGVFTAPHAFFALSHSDGASVIGSLPGLSDL